MESIFNPAEFNYLNSNMSPALLSYLASLYTLKSTSNKNEAINFFYFNDFMNYCTFITKEEILDSDNIYNLKAIEEILDFMNKNKTLIPEKHKLAGKVALLNTTFKEQFDKFIDKCVENSNLLKSYFENKNKPKEEEKEEKLITRKRKIKPKEGKKEEEKQANKSQTHTYGSKEGIEAVGKMKEYLIAEKLINDKTSILRIARAIINKKKKFSSDYQKIIEGSILPKLNNEEKKRKRKKKKRKIQIICHQKKKVKRKMLFHIKKDGIQNKKKP